MRIINLIENTPGARGALPAHGLSFYVETPMHKLLMDLGPSADSLDNARLLGVDLTRVDTVILSHGHYDHSGGIMPFSMINDMADIYMQESATGDYYAIHGNEYRYIGIDKAIRGLERLHLLKGDTVLDDELSVFVIDNKTEAIPFTNKRLKVPGAGGYVQDDFGHEQALVINAEGRSVLMSGCAHNGIINILEEYRRKIGGDPDLVISGFHLDQKADYTDDEKEEIRHTARKLQRYDSLIYTCHCTGVRAYETMKEIMGDQLRYLHSGDEIEGEL